MQIVCSSFQTRADGENPTSHKGVASFIKTRSSRSCCFRKREERVKTKCSSFGGTFRDDFRDYNSVNRGGSLMTFARPLFYLLSIACIATATFAADDGFDSQASAGSLQNQVADPALFGQPAQSAASDLF